MRRTSDAEIRDLFERLNTNTVALNDQEIRNAKYIGAFKQLAERLADSPIFQEMGLFSARDIRRMSDVEFISELLILTIQGISNKKDLVESYYARFEEELPGVGDYYIAAEKSDILLVAMRGSLRAGILAGSST